MSSQHIKAYSRLKIDRPKSSFLTWIFGNSEENDRIPEEEDQGKHIERTPSNYVLSESPPVPIHDISNKSEIKIPTRHQSRLYTPDILSVELDTSNRQEYKRRSCYSARLSTAYLQGSSSLTRSASWQPTSSNHNTNNNVLDCIPDRRTSRNYAQDPDIQAKLNEMISSERTLKVTQLIAQHHQHRH
jgi:hypothetical protein